MPVQVGPGSSSTRLNSFCLRDRDRAVASAIVSMPKYAQLVMGPAGSGKSTFCNVMRQHLESLRRSVHIINLDPAAENFEYPVSVDISDLVTVQDIMDELRYGPNGGLLYALEYLAENTDWLKEQLGEFEDDYLIIDCPGQIELYTHIPVMNRIFSELQSWGYTLVSLYLIDSQFMTDTSKFISASLMCLSAMLQFELPHLNIITKMDLLGSKGESDEMEKFFSVDVRTLTAELNKSMRPDFRELNHAIANVVDDFNMVSYLPLNIKDDESIAAILYQIDTATQYGETEEPREPGDGDVDWDNMDE